MRCVLLCFDSLNRHLLSSYGCDWTHTPNFRRLAEKTITFDRAYVGSMPCMPARRELHTGRPGFLHRNWGPLEPFDDSSIQILGDAGVQTHLASDHYHYWEEHSANYHCRYKTWEFFRGQEGDPFFGHAGPVDEPWHQNKKGRPQDWINRSHINREEDFSLVQTIDAGLRYIDHNKAYDDWFIQIECFDPHEPWFSPRKYKDLFPEHFAGYDGPLFDWPGYCEVDEPPSAVEHAKYMYAAQLAFCDAQLGLILDKFDEENLWEDTALVVWTDHGFLLGEHNWWAKNSPPWYEELSHVPLFIHDPRSPQFAGERRQSLVQTIDLAPTLLDLFGHAPTADMLGKSLTDVINTDTGGREVGIFGGFGHYVNVTDGQHVYMRAPVHEHGRPLSEYTITPSHLRKQLEWNPPVQPRPVEPKPWSKGLPLWQIEFPPGRGGTAYRTGHLLYNVIEDPRQQNPIDDPQLTQRMTDMLIEQMQIADAPPEQYQRLGL